MSDTNVNLAESDLTALAEARKWAWIRRKVIRTKRYRRQYARRMPAERMIPVSAIVNVTVTISEALRCEKCGLAETQLQADLRRFNTGFSACCGSRLVSMELYRGPIFAWGPVGSDNLL